jgi:hypothetical protein
VTTTDIGIPAGLQLLRQEVPEHLIGKLPKVNCGDCKKKRCEKHSPSKCAVCGGWLGFHIHLDYVGHAETTAQLLEADIGWNWEPVAFDANGLPVFDADGGLWIKLTVCGITRLGYGTADNANGFKSPGDIRKEIIGDALRNAAMRFGWALNLWAKTDIHERAPQEEPEQPKAAPRRQAQRPQPKARASAPSPVEQSRPTEPPVDEWTLPAAPAAEAPAKPKEPTPGQKTKLAILIAEKRGPLSRDARMAVLTELVNRPVGSGPISSINDLTFTEAHLLIDRLNAEPPHVADAVVVEDQAPQQAPSAPNPANDLQAHPAVATALGTPVPAQTAAREGRIVPEDEGISSADAAEQLLVDLQIKVTDAPFDELPGLYSQASRALNARRLTTRQFVAFNALYKARMEDLADAAEAAPAEPSWSAQQFGAMETRAEMAGASA